MDSLAILFVLYMVGCAGPQTESSHQSEDENIIEIDVVEESINNKQHHSGPSYYDDTKTDGTSAGTSQTSSTIKKPNIHIYVENSGSMYGYVGVGHGSDFRNMVFNYLTDVKISGIFEDMNLNFVNSKVIPLGSVVDDFVKKLDPNTFRVAGGNGGATDIAEIIKRVYPKGGEVAVLVSECIISPGKGHNASEYLSNQQTGIKGFLAQRPNLSQTGVIVYRMLGQFKGNYYDTVDSKKFYSGIRPYYVWVMGDVATVKELRRQTETKMKTQPDKIGIITSGNKNVKYHILSGGGKYRLSHADPKTTIDKVGKVKTSAGSRVVVKINVDYSQMLQDEAYLTDVANYEVSDPMFRVDAVTKTSDSQYVITVSCTVIKKGSIYVRLKNKPPQWVAACSDTDGGFPNPKDTHQTTYGLSYLIGGVYDAYTFKSDNLAEMKITIK